MGRSEKVAIASSPEPRRGREASPAGVAAAFFARFFTGVLGTYSSSLRDASGLPVLSAVSIRGVYVKEGQCGFAEEKSRERRTVGALAALVLLRVA